MRVVGIALLLVALMMTSARGLVLCTTADGKTYAGDTPPPGCKVQSEYTSPAAEAQTPQRAVEEDGASRKATDAAAVETHALMERRRIEREANDAAEQLDEVRQRIASLAPVNTAGFNANLGGLMAYDQSATSRAESMTTLRTQERELLTRIRECRTRFDDLTSSLAKQRGSLPASWSPRMRCDRCP